MLDDRYGFIDHEICFINLLLENLIVDFRYLFLISEHFGIDAHAVTRVQGAIEWVSKRFGKLSKYSFIKQ